VAQLVVLVTGDRNWTRDNTRQSGVVLRVLRPLRKFKAIVVHGDARGVDSIADFHARRLGLEVRPHAADWSKYHRAAGPIRNREMLEEEEPNLVLAFHDDLRGSKGTKDMVNQALRHGIKVMHIMSNGTQEVLTRRVA
jgi:YspA, cpYpsA-related SLOG family